MKKTLLSLMGCALLSMGTYAQSTSIDYSNARDGESVEYCLTHKKMNVARNNPAAAAAFAHDEIIRAQEASEVSAEPKATVWYIPIVFHILHNGGPENISDAQVMDAFDILNRDYKLLNADAATVHPDFTGMPADVDIEFRLATLAPDGTCFNGITRTQSSMSFSSNGTGQKNAVKNGNDVYQGEWPGDEYLNVFICGDIGGAAGYTTTPSTWVGSDMGNGIWILHNYLGSVGTSAVYSSRALTHEVGHWLNLEHVWGPNNNPGNASSCSDDDYVTDTPNEIGVTSCNLNEMTCGPRANVENYMDYSYCSKMFTQGQVTRMRNALNSTVANRKNLKTAANLTATGATGVFYLCTANFTADRTSVCAGEQVQFTDQSYNAVSGWTWNFPGGTPASSTSQNPLVTYNTPGLYQVELTATDGTLSETETKTSFIRVLPPAATLPFLEDFESFSTLNNIEEWGIYNDGGNKWELETSTGHTGTKCARLLNNGQSSGNMDELISSPVDLSGVTSSVTLSFRYAYKRKSSTDDDWFRVQVTSDCGENWAIRKTLHGAQLTSAIQTSSFVPSSINDWTTVHMTNVTSTFWTDKFRYKFAFEAGGGNNMYIDNINIYTGSPSDDLVVGLEEGTELDGLSVYPNPTEGELNIRFNVAAANDVVLNVQDLSGKTVMSNTVKANAGANVVFMDTQKLANGMYFLDIQMGGNKRTIQFVVK